MTLEQWGSMVQRRFGRYLMALLGGGEEGFSIEDDPVGEFLSRKEEEAGQSEDEGTPMPAIANPEQQAVEVGTENVEVQGPAVEDREQSLDGPEKVAVDLVETSLDGNEEPLAQLEDQARVAAVTDADSQGPEVESESVEMAATADAAPQTLEVESQSAEEADSTQREKAADDEEVGSLLDVFKDEELSESPISTLSRELSDTNIYSLLEEMKQIAEKVRKRL